MTAVRYTAQFFDDIDNASRSAAGVIVPCAFELFHPGSVADVGCGLGAWVAAFLEGGADAIGVDGDYVNPDQLQIPRDRFLSRDLTLPLRMDRRFDLVSCVEVAEHLPSERAQSFVSDLCALAPIVMFGAAIPGQGGNGHVNEQWPEYWRDIFATFEYRQIDCFRHRFWYDRRVAAWYAQNLFLYAHKSVVGTYAHLHHEWPLSAVHPFYFAGRVQPTPWKLLPAFLKASRVFISRSLRLQR